MNIVDSNKCKLNITYRKYLVAYYENSIYGIKISRCIVHLNNFEKANLETFEMLHEFKGKSINIISWSLIE